MRKASLIRNPAPIADSAASAQPTPRQQMAANVVPAMLPSCFASSFTRFGSAGAAGELLHVPSEGLCAQFPCLDHRQVRKELVGKLVHGHAGAQRQRSALDD